MGVRSRSPIAGAQFALAVSSSAVTLTVPAGCGTAEMYVRGDSVTFTRDGTTPTATKGFTAYVDDMIILNSLAECQGFKVIRVSTDATLDVEYFSDVSG